MCCQFHRRQNRMRESPVASNRVVHITDKGIHPQIAKLLYLPIILELIHYVGFYFNYKHCLVLTTKDSLKRDRYQVNQTLCILKWLVCLSEHQLFSDVRSARHINITEIQNLTSKSPEAKMLLDILLSANCDAVPPNLLGYLRKPFTIPLWPPCLNNCKFRLRPYSQEVAKAGSAACFIW